MLGVGTWLSLDWGAGRGIALGLVLVANASMGCLSCKADRVDDSNSEVPLVDQSAPAISILEKHGYTFIDVEPGTFPMGTDDEEEKKFNLTELREERVGRAFAMGRTEVTQGLYEEVMGANPSHYRECGGNCPVEQVKWADAVEFCNKLSEAEGLAPVYSRSGEGWNWDREASGYRLPTEIEWEYAAKAGEALRYSGSDDPGEVGWSKANSGDEGLREVGLKKANAWGFHDMSGNVWEWTWDWFEEPRFKSCRGGSHNVPALSTTTTFRGYYNVDTVRADVGLRLVRNR